MVIVCADFLQLYRSLFTSYSLSHVNYLSVFSRDHILSSLFIAENVDYFFVRVATVVPVITTFVYLVRGWTPIFLSLFLYLFDVCIVLSYLLLLYGYGWDSDRL